jgi:hypothetical protein
MLDAPCSGLLALEYRSARATYPPLSVVALDLMMIARPLFGPAELA